VLMRAQKASDLKSFKVVGGQRRSQRTRRSHRRSRRRSRRNRESRLAPCWWSNAMLRS
jgi:hypothetical protein